MCAVEMQRLTREGAALAVQAAYVEGKAAGMSRFQVGIPADPS